MVNILSILLFILDKICQGEGTQDQNKKQRNKQA